MTNDSNINNQTCSFSVKLKNYFSPMFMKKKQNNSNHNLKKCLTTFDLTSLGVGAVLGAGVYVVAGQVASLIAGPSIIISFTISAFASLLSGISYAEFGCRVPNTTGGAYAYSYASIGQIWAFFIGWNLILEYMIGTAADASALSASIEHIVNSTLGNASFYFAPFDPIIGDNRPDLVAFFLTIAVTLLLALGCKDSARFGIFCNIVNVCAILFFIIAGSFYADISRWSSYDKFFPFGLSGTFSGAAACFYAFVGFDIIATTGEEAATPSTSIPKAIVFTLFFVVCCYIGVSIIATMITNYSNLGEKTPLVMAFQYAGLPWGAHIMSIGAVFGVSSSLLGSMFPLPRIIFAMASDRLIHPIFSHVNNKTNIPIIATIIPGVMTALFALIFELKDLVEMMSIGTLLAYSLVSLCVIILRYQPINKLSNKNIENKLLATNTSYKKAMISLIICICTSTLISLVISVVSFKSINLNLQIYLIIFITFCGILFSISYLFLYFQPQNNQNISFKAPFVPAIPMSAIIINIFLMLKLSKITWIRFCIWMILGIITYFGYSITNSKFTISKNIDDTT